MSEVTLEIHSRSYDIVCKSGDEDKVRALGKEIDSRLDVMDISLERVPPAKGFLMLCLVLLDEIKELQAAGEGTSSFDTETATVAGESIENSIANLKTIVSDLEKL